jgi:hypothetical protein
MTASELVLRGRMQGDLALVERARESARDAVEWCAIAEALPRERAGDALARALALAGSDVRVYRNVARIERTRFEDVAAATRALAAGAEALLAHHATTRDWCALADAWRAAGDRDAALHYLEHARASAETVADWCAVGQLARAEALARTVGERALVVQAWDGAQDLERVLANLAAAVPAIATVEDAVILAGLLGHYDQDATPAFAAGGALARTPRDFIALARIAQSDGDCQRWLERGAAEGDDATRGLAEHLARARGFRGGTDEPVPALVLPHDMLPRSARTLGWPHVPAALLDRLRAALPPATLDAIAAADYGQDHAEHLAALDEIQRTGGVRHPLPWFPLEVLQLVRWSEGDAVDHLARAFACTVLCIDDAGPLRWHDGNESTIAVLLHSAIALGTEAVDDVIGLLAAMANAYRDDELRAFAELALVLAAVWRDATDPRIAPLVTRLISDEARLREQTTRWSERWLLGITNFDLRHELWRALAQSILAPSVGHDPQLTRLAELLR